jgi:hypothetical protein
VAVNLHLSHLEIQTLRRGQAVGLKSLTFSIIRRVGGEDTLARKARGSVDDRNGAHQLRVDSPIAVRQAHLPLRNAGPLPLSLKRL